MNGPTENGPDWEELPDGTVIVRPAQIVRKYEERRLVRLRHETAQMELEAAKLRVAGLGQPKRENAPRKLGMHGNTMSRVREAWGLVQQGVPRTTACKRSGIDPRTYDRYVMDITCPDNEE